MAFARRQIVPIRWLNRLPPLAVVAATYFLFAVTASVWIFLAVHLTVLFIAALFCHTQLAAERPPADDLTEYYLWISVGGFLGGVFTTLVAPALFTRTVEYPLGLVLAVLLRPRPSAPRSSWSRAGDLALPAMLGAAAGALPAVSGFSIRDSIVVAGPHVTMALPLVASLPLVGNPTRFGLAVGAIALVAVLAPRRRDS